MFHTDKSIIFTTATSGRYTQSVTGSFVADDTDKRSAWEQSGKFEGDIVMTEEQRNGERDPTSRWPNGVVPFVIESVFGEYCRTKIQKCYAVYGGNYPEL